MLIAGGPSAIRIGIFAAACLVAGLPGIALRGDAAPLLWPIAGLVSGVLLRTEPRQWTAWCVVAGAASIGAWVAAGRPPPVALAFATADLLEAVAAAWLVGRRAGPFRLDSLRRLARLAGLGAAAAPLAGAALRSLSLYLHDGTSVLATGPGWWLASAVGVVTVAPAVLTWRDGWPSGARRDGRDAEWAALLAAAVALPAALLGALSIPILFPMAAVLLWAAIRFGPAEAACANLALAAVALVVSALGVGPAGGETAVHRLLLQAGLALMALGPSLAVALILAERQRVARERERNEARLRSLLDNAPMSIALHDLSGRFLAANQRFRGWYGDPDLRLGETRISDLFAADLADRVAADVERLVRERRATIDEYEIALSDGRPHWLRVTRFPIVDEDGGVTATGSIAIDFTEERRSQEQLRQSQKMDAVGQLTGGISHDFNNLLSVMVGNLEMVLDDLPPDSPGAERAGSALKAAERGAELTQRLLAFSRKQALQPVALDLNETVRGMHEMLRRTLGEEIDIEIVGAGGLWRCEADAAQVESAILNLAINARDAMPEGGRLIIETANARLDDDYAAAQLDVTPGQYVMIAVGDTGFGIPADQLERVFEPFFTTKAQGRGTGLGLSMVLGFVKQSGGHVRIYSEPGIGTTVKIYLPRSREPAADPPPPPAAAYPRGRHERVLVVEDDIDVRTLTVALLQSLGYAILEARDGPSALALARSEGPVDLLLTDVVLSGGIGGRELARRMAEIRPGLRVLYMSGYTANGIVHHGRLEPGVELLQKPFRKADLARAVQRALGAQAAGGGDDTMPSRSR